MKKKKIVLNVVLIEREKNPLFFKHNENFILTWWIIGGAVTHGPLTCRINLLLMQSGDFPYT